MSLGTRVNPPLTLIFPPGVEQPLSLSHRALTDPLLLGAGEANAFLHTDRYNCTFPALIADWRQAFHTGSAGQTEPLLPFGFVQVRWGVRGRTPTLLGGWCHDAWGGFTHPFTPWRPLPSRLEGDDAVNLRTDPARVPNPRQGPQWPVLGAMAELLPQLPTPLFCLAVVHLSPAEPARQLHLAPLAPNSRSGGCPQRQDAQHLHGRGDGSV